MEMEKDWEKKLSQGLEIKVLLLQQERRISYEFTIFHG